MFTPKYYIDLNDCAQVKEFVRVAQTKTCEVILVGGRYQVDGKSVLGIFSLDLSRPVGLIVMDEDYTAFMPFIVNY